MSPLQKTMFMNVFGDGELNLSQAGVEVHELPFTVESLFEDTTPDAFEISETNQAEVILRGESIAVIRDSNGETSSIVIFKPTPVTRKAVRTYEGQNVALHIDDRNGQFTPKFPQRITGAVYEFGNETLLVSTENQ